MDIEKMETVETNASGVTATEQTEEVNFTSTEDNGGANGTEQATAEATGQEPAQTASAEDKAKQSSDENAKFARERRKAEEAKRLKEAQETARTQTIIALTGGKNPYNGEKIEDAHDAEEYLLMKQIEAEGGDPLADYAKYQNKKAKEEAQKLLNEQKRAEAQKKDIEGFKEAYPDVDLDTLIQDEAFSDYAEGKVGKKPLADIYAGYLKLTGTAQKKGEKEVAQKIANAQSSPGTANANAGSAEGFFTREQVLKMSSAEQDRNWEAIMRSMSKW